MSRTKAGRVLLLATAGLLIAAGCSRDATGGSGAPAGGVSPRGGAGGEGGQRPIRVLATIGMIGDVAARIAGPHAVVDTLMAPSVDPHLYKASEGDLRRLEGADLILYNGLNLEGKMGDVLVKMARRRRVLAVSESIPAEKLREPPEFKGHYDPHPWFDVSLWALTLDPIARELSEIDPAHAADFARSAAALRDELGKLDAEVEARVKEIPAERRVLVTAHDAFGYFGRRYGMDVVGIQGISTASEAGIQDIERVVDVIVKRKVKAIFVESSVPPKTIEAVQKACASRGHQVAIGGQLFSDAMGPRGTPEGTYPGMVRHNVRTIVEALR